MIFLPTLHVAEKDTPLTVPEGTEDLLEKDDSWLYSLISRPAGTVQAESEASTTEELKSANDQLSGYIKGAMKLKKKLGEQVRTVTTTRHTIVVEVTYT